jgi:hypothetical protein
MKEKDKASLPDGQPKVLRLVGRRSRAAKSHLQAYLLEEDEVRRYVIYDKEAVLISHKKRGESVEAAPPRGFEGTTRRGLLLR